VPIIFEIPREIAGIIARFSPRISISTWGTAAIGDARFPLSAFESDVRRAGRTDHWPPANRQPIYWPLSTDN
jgi:hypothetical protein